MARAKAMFDIRPDAVGEPRAARFREVGSVFADARIVRLNRG
jgi:hypothetical protein